jgi:ABC-type transport system substrate-binding protein
MKKFLSYLLIFTLVLGLTACGKNEEENNDNKGSQDVTKTEVTDAPTQDPATTTAPTAEPSVEPTAEPTPEIPWDGAYMEKEDYLAYTVHDLETVFEAIEDQLEDAEYQAVKTVVDNGVAAINASNTVSEAEKAYEDAFNGILNAIPKADGLYTFKKESNAEKTNILGILEQFAVSKGITGISLYENGRYQMYNPRVTLGTENYIVGYGFGVLAEGSINSDLEAEPNEAWKRYYHTFESEDPGTLNELNDQRASVGDLYDYTAATFVTKFMNATKDGYDWVPELAKDKPQPVNDDDGDGLCTTWRMEVKTGADGLKYKTGSEMANRKAFDGREVALEDYEYAFKLLLTQSNQLYRGSELANTANSSAIAGAKDYYDATADGYKEELWKNVGIKTYVEDGKNYFEVTFAGLQDQFYAMYYISSSLYMPIPEDFIKLVTVKKYLGFSEDGKETPVDNALTVGPYYLERYDSDQQIVFKKNPYYIFADTKYAVEGIYVKIFTAINTDKNAAIKEFLADHFDAAGVTQDYLDEYKNDPRTRKTTGTSNFKLNANACDEETWEYLFGENGVVKQTPKAEYWTLKPCIGNAHFRKALSLAINRKQFAEARGSIASVDYFSSNYMSDPENGISYATTDAHKKAVANLLQDTDGAGYSLELAREYFRMALTELEKAGAYKPGTKENPTEIQFEIAWMYPSDEEDFHKEIKNYIETAFNDDSVCGGVYKLTVNFWVGNQWSDVYYNKLMVGQFDLGFGSISGNELDPLGFLNVLSSDQLISGSFTLNWGTDTNDPDVYPLVYDGKRWSFDALYNAANVQAIVSEGQNKEIVAFDYTNISKNDDGTYSGSLKVTAALPGITKVDIQKIVCCNYDRYYNGDGTYVEKEVEFTVDDSTKGTYVVNFTVPADIVEEFTKGEGLPEQPTGSTGFDIYYGLEFNGEPSDTYHSVEDTFVIE